MNTIKSKVQSEEEKVRNQARKEEKEFVVFTYEDELFTCQIKIVKENGSYVKSIVNL